MIFKFEKPVFIEDSFIAPIFSSDFEKDLLDISKHLALDIKDGYPKDPDIIAKLSEYSPNGADKDDKLVEDVIKTINELVRINRKLLKIHDYDGRDYAIRSLLTNENANRIMQCVREIQCYIFDLPRKSEICIRLEKLTHFLVEITTDNGLVQRKVRCNQ